MLTRASNTNWEAHCLSVIVQTKKIIVLSILNYPLPYIFLTREKCLAPELYAIAIYDKTLIARKMHRKIVEIALL